MSRRVEPGHATRLRLIAGQDPSRRSEGARQEGENVLLASVVGPRPVSRAQDGTAATEHDADALGVGHAATRRNIVRVPQVGQCACPMSPSRTVGSVAGRDRQAEQRQPRRQGGSDWWRSV